MDYFAGTMGKDFSALKNKLRDEDITFVSELAVLSDADLKELGFTIGLKTKLKNFIAERQPSQSSNNMQEASSFN